MAARAQQGFGGTVNLAGIRAVVQALRTVPVIGNGDVTTPQAAKAMLEQTGCAGVSIGRGAFYNPWIFHHTRHYLDTGELLPEPSLRRTRARHVPPPGPDDRGLRRGARLPHVPQGGARGIPSGSARPRSSTTTSCRSPAARSSRTCSTATAAGASQFLDESGELKPRFRPPPMTASFMQEPGAEAFGHIPVPKGPVEVW